MIHKPLTQTVDTLRVRNDDRDTILVLLAREGPTTRFH